MVLLKTRTITNADHWRIYLFVISCLEAKSVLAPCPLSWRQNSMGAGNVRAASCSQGLGGWGRKHRRGRGYAMVPKIAARLYEQPLSRADTCISTTAVGARFEGAGPQHLQFPSTESWDAIPVRTPRLLVSNKRGHTTRLHRS